jgi:hypothetical protein
MPYPAFHRREYSAAQRELFGRILDRIHRDLPDAIGLAVTVHDRRHEHAPTILAADGFGQEFVGAQLDWLRGPLIDAVEHQVPVLSPSLCADDRWPGLTCSSLQARYPDHSEVWGGACGAVAVPGVWQDDETTVLTCVLGDYASADTVLTLIGYEQLIAAAMMTAAAQDESDVADMLAVLQSRGAIEQAKGAIMGLLRCDADAAWSTLRQASHESNIKLRVLAVALVEHISGSPVEQPVVGAPIIPSDPARRAAGLLWTVLTHAASNQN